MTTTLLSLVVALVAFVVTRRATRDFTRTAPLRRRNYRGLEIPTGIGVAPLLGFLAGLATLPVLRVPFDDSLTVFAAASIGLPYAAAALGFGLLGLWDDLTARGGRGWRAHLSSARRARFTSGVVKLVGGVALALVLVAPVEVGGIWMLINAAIVAMTANLFNLLDLRPGRAGKWFLLGALPMIVLGGATAPALAAGMAAVIGFLPFDLRERAMLGDAGANGLGAILGVTVVALGSHEVKVAVLLFLVVLHVLGERPGLSRAIQAVPPLRRLDEMGRVPEPADDPIHDPAG